MTLPACDATRDVGALLLAAERGDMDALMSIARPYRTAPAGFNALVAHMALWCHELLAVAAVGLQVRPDELLAAMLLEIAREARQHGEGL